MLIFDVDLEGEEKMRKKMFKKCKAENEAFEQYLHAIGAYLNYVNEQMEEV